MPRLRKYVPSIARSLDLLSPYVAGHGPTTWHIIDRNVQTAEPYQALCRTALRISSSLFQSQMPVFGDGRTCLDCVRIYRSAILAPAIPH